MPLLHFKGIWTFIFFLRGLIECGLVLFCKFEKGLRGKFDDRGSHSKRHGSMGPIHKRGTEWNSVQWLQQAVTAAAKMWVLITLMSNICDKKYSFPPYGSFLKGRKRRCFPRWRIMFALGFLCGVILGWRSFLHLCGSQLCWISCFLSVGRTPNRPVSVQN
ncbi:hypothetical protein Nepgr_009155 [Nepenthes gracilis]|uniref:Uncharacterized protein n=1 Tax=Nepenthes gracilis TaxID=150966 RepID=A0AAD3SAB2_NEPGR|nr:hypothetical protein Nepgr_009155 [Nepenthes gracilis]